MKISIWDLIWIGHYVVEKVLRNDFYFVHTKNTMKSQILHCFRLRKFSMGTPLEDIYINEQLENGDKIVNSQYSLYSIAQEKEPKCSGFGHPKVYQDRTLFENTGSCDTLTQQNTDGLLTQKQNNAPNPSDFMQQSDAQPSHNPVNVPKNDLRVPIQALTEKDYTSNSRFKYTRETESTASTNFNNPIIQKDEATQNQTLEV